ncbi:MAG: nicotinamide riboside transporter PnuC [Clostridiales bacterium]|nr:nicotinamide riboside transporter PnuC [Clostridiales bacterium]
MDLFIEILGLTVGLIYLWYEYHANPLMWLASVVMPCISMYIYWSKGLYADFSINIYYLAIAVYGYLHWTHGPNTKKTARSTASPSTGRKVTRLPLWGLSVSIVSTVILWWLLWWLLNTFTDSNVPVADAFTTALSIVALWMLARKWAEQWLAWLVVDAVCVFLYIYKGIYPYAILYGIYTAIAWLGYVKWKRLASEQA